jgi:hypothetical protein
MAVTVGVPLSTAEARDARTAAAYQCADGLIVRRAVPASEGAMKLYTTYGSPRFVSDPLITINKQMITSASISIQRVSMPPEDRRKAGGLGSRTFLVTFELESAAQQHLGKELGDRRYGDTEQFQRHGDVYEQIQRDLGESGWDRIKFAKVIVECGGFGIDATLTGRESLEQLIIPVDESISTARRFARMFSRRVDVEGH